MKKIKQISAPPEADFYLFPSKTIHFSQIMMNGLECASCSRLFLFILRTVSNLRAISHQYQSLRVFTVKVIIVDLIKVCLQWPNQTHY